MQTTSRFTRVLAALVVVASLVLVASPAETQTPSAAQIEHEAWVMLNQFRVAHGRPALPRHSGLDADARGWSTVMSWTSGWNHSPNILSDTLRHTSSRPVCAGENVGVRPTSWGYPYLHHEFVHSPVHRSFMLGTTSYAAPCGGWDYVGVGVVLSGGKTWITFRFAAW